jgi:hypothetical protein
MSSEITDSFKPDSSSVIEVWFNKHTLDLWIEFKGNRKYKYSSVPEDVYNNIKSADSVGKFVNNNIVDVYPTERIY